MKIQRNIIPPEPIAPIVTYTLELTEREFELLKALSAKIGGGYDENLYFSKAYNSENNGPEIRDLFRAIYSYHKWN